MADSITTSRIDVNADFDRARTGQIESLVRMREDHQARISDFESGKAQAAIDTEIARRICAGEIMMIGPDRYRALVGWDRGENFTVQKARNPGELTLIEPESGLDFLNGEFQGWFDRPEWHRLGQVDIGGLSNIDEVLAKSGLDFEVLQRPVRYFDDDGNLREMPEAFVNYRSDNCDGLGVVGKIYTPIQNREGFEFLQTLVDDGSAKFASAFPLYDGKRCVISMELPEDITIDAEGAADHVKLYVCWFNNHDGQGCLTAKITPWRPRCGNTERLAVAGALTSWSVRHTTNATRKIDEARRQLQMTGQWAEKFTAEENLLARSAATMDDVLTVMESIWTPDENPSKRGVTIAQQREDQLAGLWGTYRTELGATKYAAERVFTDWFDHVAPRRAVNGGSMAAARATAALTGADDKDKARAHKVLMALASGGTETR